MGSFFGEVVEPTTRALIDDCSDEENTNETLLQLVWDKNCAKIPDFSKLLIVEGNVALAFTEAYLLDSTHIVVGKIHYDIESSGNSDFKQVSPSPLILQDDFLICFVSPSLPAKAGYNFADLVSFICKTAKEVVLLNSQSLNNYKQISLGGTPKAAVYSFATSCFKGPLRAPSPAPANIITGICAAASGPRRRLDLDYEQINKSEIIAADDLEQMNLGDDSITDGPQSMATVARTRSDRDRKLGHRRVREDGHTTYKKVQTDQIMGSIQLGIQHAVGGLASKPERDLLMQDFMTVETYNFPSMGSNHTPAHHFSEFRFKNYAPIAFRYFRELFGIQPDDFLITMCYAPLRELSNPGASGSVFYVTDDDELIIKTVQHKEGEFLQKLLPGYYMNINQNPRTLLPKFFGLYCYQLTGKNIRLVVMNNLLPNHIKMHQKYDLKGSTYKRKANKTEKEKASPTFKDLDFMEHHPEGLYLDPDTYSLLMKTIQRDCQVLESFKIMDYSLLVGIHNQDADRSPDEEQELTRRRSMRQRVMAHATPMESIQAQTEEEDEIPSGGIPAKNAKGDRLILYVGIIDILQSYKFKKMLEHTWKAMIHDGDTVSVHRPDFYAQRFKDFMAKQVFRKMAFPARVSVWKRKSLGRASRQETPRAALESSSFTSGIGSLAALTSCNSATTNGSDGSPMPQLSGELHVQAEIVRHVTTIHVQN